MLLGRNGQQYWLKALANGSATGGAGAVMKHLGGRSKAAEREGQGKNSHASLQPDPVISSVGNSAGIAETEAPAAEHKSSMHSSWSIPQLTASGVKPG